MPDGTRHENARIIRIFVSSPDDVAEERAVLADVVASINRTVGQPGGFRLELVRWEYDVVREMGLRPQQNIDAEIPAYDIYLGIMSARFGRPTGHYGSGTEKEFKDALKQREKDGVPCIAFYFDDQPAVSGELEVAKQYMRVCEFREWMREIGLFETYKGVRGSEESFYEKVLIHLSRIAQRLIAPQEPPRGENPQAVDENSEKEGGEAIRVFREDVAPNLVGDLLHDLEQELAVGRLKDSILGPLVHAALRTENGLETASDYDPHWITTGILESDLIYPPIQQSAGEKDWQKQFAEIATPILVGVARSLKRSAGAQASVIWLCDLIAEEIKLHLEWPDDPNKSNDLKNAIYRECLRATDVLGDDVLRKVQKITVLGP